MVTNQSDFIVCKYVEFVFNFSDPITDFTFLPSLENSIKNCFNGIRSKKTTADIINISTFYKDKSLIVLLNYNSASSPVMRESGFIFLKDQILQPDYIKQLNLSITEIQYVIYKKFEDFYSLGFVARILEGWSYISLVSYDPKNLAGSSEKRVTPMYMSGLNLPLSTQDILLPVQVAPVSVEE
jgi:hypothetical protein